MIEWKYIVVLLGVVLLLFLLWKEIRRKQKQRLLWRLVATVLAVASLVCMALPITYRTTEHSNINNKAIILTAGFDADSVNNFIKQNPNTPVLFFDKDVNPKSLNAHYVADVNLLPQEYENIQNFHVFGWGLDKEELNNLRNVSCVFHPSDLPSGITAVNWQQRLQSGEEMIVQGSYHNTSATTAKIVLSGFNTTLDSAYLAPDTQTAFTLSTVPKSLGRITYSLAVIRDNDTIENETIPVQVGEDEHLKILMLASSPDFENKFLKNQLSQSGYAVATRTIISKDKYAFDYLNLSSLALDHLSTTLLDKFDVIVADAAALNAVPKNELAILQSVVAQKGIGLIIKADTIAPAAFYTTSFPLNVAANNAQTQVATFLVDTATALPALTANYLLSINDQPVAQPLVFDKQNKVYVSSALYGSGKIVFTTLANTYAWALSGYEQAYKKYWATLLNKAAAKPIASEMWSVAPALPLVNTPVQLMLETNLSGIPQSLVNGAAVYMKMNAALPYQWSGMYYPSKRGWQTTVGLNGKPIYWYAFDKNDWQSLYAAQKVAGMQQYINKNNNYNKNTGINSIIKENDIKKVYFLLLLLICCGFLWMESKYLSINK